MCRTFFLRSLNNCHTRRVRSLCNKSCSCVKQVGRRSSRVLLLFQAPDVMSVSSRRLEKSECLALVGEGKMDRKMNAYVHEKKGQKMSNIFFLFSLARVQGWSMINDERTYIKEIKYFNLMYLFLGSWKSFSKFIFQFLLHIWKNWHVMLKEGKGY